MTPTVPIRPTRLATPCQEYAGLLNSKGYGRVYQPDPETGKNRWWPHHRWVWWQTHGPIPAGMVVMHRCDNPPCYRLDHLQLGTVADNNRDTHIKNRGGKGQPKLTFTQAEQIRRILATSSRSLAHIGTEFGVCATTILNIRLNKIWMPDHQPQETQP